jgi:hypothetical protein
MKFLTLLIMLEMKLSEFGLLVEGSELESTVGPCDEWKEELRESVSFVRKE